MSVPLALRPIGAIRTPWATPADCPRNGRQPNPAPVCRVVLDAEHRPGLEGLDGFSHLILVYWLHLAGPARLSFRPPFDAEGARLVRFLDCADNTPLLDVKPYLPTTDAEPGASMGWLAPHATGRGEG